VNGYAISNPDRLARISGPLAELRGIDLVEAIPEGVVVEVHRHRLLPAIAIQADLVIEPVGGGLRGRRAVDETAPMLSFRGPGPVRYDRMPENAIRDEERSP
jgi:hypothetical protein